MKRSHPRGKECLKRLARLSAYVDRELPPPARLRMQRHLAGCGDCRVVLRTLQKTIQLCRQTPGAKLSRAASARVLSALRRELASSEYPRKGNKPSTGRSRKRG